VRHDEGDEEGEEELVEHGSLDAGVGEEDDDCEVLRIRSMGCYMKKRKRNALRP